MLLAKKVINRVACEQALLFGRVKNESRENARASGEAGVLARFASFAQIGELARRLLTEPKARNGSLACPRLHVFASNRFIGVFQFTIVIVVFYLPHLFEGKFWTLSPMLKIQRKLWIFSAFLGSWDVVLYWNFVVRSELTLDVDNFYYYYFKDEISSDEGDKNR